MRQEKAVKRDAPPGWRQPAKRAIEGKAPLMIAGAEAPPPNEDEIEEQYALRLKELGAKNGDIADLLGRTERAVTAKFGALREKAGQKLTPKKSPRKKLTPRKKPDKKPHDLVLIGFVEAGTITPAQLADAVIEIDRSDSVLSALKESLTGEMLLKAIIRHGLSEAILSRLLAK